MNQEIEYTADRLERIQANIAHRDEEINRNRINILDIPKPLLSSTKNAHKDTYSNHVMRSHASIQSSEMNRGKLPSLVNIQQQESKKRAITSNLANSELYKRSELQGKYKSDKENLIKEEELATSLVQEANRLAEDLRIATVLYNRNEHTWTFDDRAARYHDLMEIKKAAENSRVKAEDAKKSVNVLRLELKDPYGTFRDIHNKNPSSINTVTKKVIHSTASIQLKSLTSKVCDSEGNMDSENSLLLWLLAAPNTALPFTPRDKTKKALLDESFELSTLIIYYAAPSAYTGNSNCIPDNVSEPRDVKWISCTSHGVLPSPSIARANSMIESYIVADAGASHVNGIYICSGYHDGEKKFKSPNGIELFRKRIVFAQDTLSISNIPIEVLISATLTHSTRHEQIRDTKTADLSQKPIADQPAYQPAQPVIEYDNFLTLSRIGSWLGGNETLRKLRKLRDNVLVTQSNISAGADTSLQSKDNRTYDTQAGITIQKSATTSNILDTLASRTNATPSICREWLLFKHCTQQARNSKNCSLKSKDYGVGCLKRHYYISALEKQALNEWVHSAESDLEKMVLKRIIVREEILQQLRSLGAECTRKFQESLDLEAYDVAANMLQLMSHMRMSTVKVLEAIGKWRVHVQKSGFAHEDITSADRNELNDVALGWSASITLPTGKMLYKKSHAFQSKIKRYQRTFDQHGKKEVKIVYLGYFRSKFEAEQAYDTYASAEARRLNTTTTHLPIRRSVLRSCGKHYAVESERLGPSMCIECMTKDKTGLEMEWKPPFCYTFGENYILKLTSDLDFLYDIEPLQVLLQKSNQINSTIPLKDNPLLLSRTPLQDPKLALLCTSNSKSSGDIAKAYKINGELVDYDRLLNAEKMLVEEIELYISKEPVHPQPIFCQQNPGKVLSNIESVRLIQALYWDSCASFKIQQTRPALPFRNPMVWCRSDAGEWADLKLHGKHLKHFNFEQALFARGKELQKQRKKIVSSIRKLLTTPMYLLPSLEFLKELLKVGTAIKGDVVLFEVANLTKYVIKYELWITQTRRIQRMYRGFLGRRRASLRKFSFEILGKLRCIYETQIAYVAKTTYNNVIYNSAMVNTIKRLQKSIWTKVTKLDGEYVILSFYSILHNQSDAMSQRLQTSLCKCCTRVYHKRMISQSTENGVKFVTSSGICICSWAYATNSKQINEENWLVRAYNPKNKRTYRFYFQGFLLRQFERLLCKPNYNEHSNLSVFAAYCKTLKLHHQIKLRANLLEYISQMALINLNEWLTIHSDALHRLSEAVRRLENADLIVRRAKKYFQESSCRLQAATNIKFKHFNVAQSWDPLENANDLCILVEKRKLELELDQAKELYHLAYHEFFQIQSDEAYVRESTNNFHKYINKNYIPDHHQLQMELRAASSNISKARLQFEKFLSCCQKIFTLRSRGIPLRRLLVIYQPRYDKDMGTLAIPSSLRKQQVILRRALQFRRRSTSLPEEIIIFIVEVRACSSTWSKPLVSENSAERDFIFNCYNPLTSDAVSIHLNIELIKHLLSQNLTAATWLSKISYNERNILWAKKLLELAIIDDSTQQLTLARLRYTQTFLFVKPLIYSSAWFQDIQSNRKTGKGDEILRHAMQIDGRLCVVSIYENWGDLTMIIYHTATAKTYTAIISFDQITRNVLLKPILLDAWLQCVKTNNYAISVLTHITALLRFHNKFHVETLNLKCQLFTPKTNSIKYTVGKIVGGRRVTIKIREDTFGDFMVLAFCFQSNKSYSLILEQGILRRLLCLSDTRRESQINLLLQNNRRKLYEWIVSRLTFQNIIKQSSVGVKKSSLHSPIVAKASIRTSLTNFNIWIQKSHTPLKIFSEEFINNVGLEIEQNSYAKLYYDQLVLCDNLQTCYNLEKNYVMTTQCEHANYQTVTIDWFVQRCDIYAQIRQDFESELKAQEQAQLYEDITSANTAIDSIEPMTTGLLIPSSKSEKVEEIFVNINPSQIACLDFKPGDLSSTKFLECLQSVCDIMDYNEFRGNSGYNTLENLQYKHIQGGVLLFLTRDIKRNSVGEEWNTRASALLHESHVGKIYGAAIMLPYKSATVLHLKKACDTISLQQKSLDSTGISSGNNSKTPKDQLSWKVNAIERIKANRKWRSNYKAQGLALKDEDDIDLSEETALKFEVSKLDRMFGMGFDIANAIHKLSKNIMIRKTTSPPFLKVEYNAGEVQI